METSAYTFWTGAPWDMVARQYVADTLNKVSYLKPHTYKRQPSDAATTGLTLMVCGGNG